MAYRPKIGYYYHTSGWLTMNNNKPKKLRSLYSAKMFLKKNAKPFQTENRNLLPTELFYKKC